MTIAVPTEEARKRIFTSKAEESFKTFIPIFLSMNFLLQELLSYIMPAMSLYYVVLFTFEFGSHREPKFITVTE